MPGAPWSTGWTFAPPPAHVTRVITDLGVLEPREGELTLTSLHPGASVEQARAATGWGLRITDQLTATAAPTSEELSAARAGDR